MLNTTDAYFLFDSQNYRKKEMEIIYGNLEKVNLNTLDKLIDKAIDNNDWRIVEHVLAKYDLKGYLIKKVEKH